MEPTSLQSINQEPWGKQNKTVLDCIKFEVTVHQGGGHGRQLNIRI